MSRDRRFRRPDRLLPVALVVLLALAVGALAWGIRSLEAPETADAVTAAEVDEDRGTTELVPGVASSAVPPAELGASLGERQEITPSRPEPNPPATVRVRGRVRDQLSGAPIEGAFVSVVEPAGKGTAVSDAWKDRRPLAGDSADPSVKVLATAGSDVHGRFELSVAPGTRILKVRLERRPGFAVGFDAVLGRDAEFDVEIQSVWDLPVELRGPDGSMLGDWLRSHPEERTSIRFDLVESEAPPAERIPADRTRRGELAARRWMVASVDHKTRAPVVTTLSVLAPWPRWVAAYVEDQLAASRLVDEHEERIELRIPERFLGRNTSDTSLRVVDAESGAPIPGARASLLPVGTFASATVESDRSGMLRFGGVRMGRMSLTVIARGRAWLQEEVTIGPGPHTDLGVRALASKATITGTISPEDGLAPQKVSLLAFPLDRFDETRRQREKFSYAADAHGRFAISPVGRERYLLRCADGAYACDPLVVDTSEGDVEGVVVRVSRGVEARFVFEEPVDATLRIVDRTGLPVRELDLAGAREGTLRVTEGEYSWRLEAGGRTLQEGSLQAVADAGEVSAIRVGRLSR